jgi:HK97 family phage prohead protease
MTRRRELRAAPITEVSEDGRTITVRAVVYGVVDDYNTVFMPGCFARSLAERMPVFAWSHDWSEPIGRAIAFDDQPDALYLTLRASDPDAVPRARQAIVQFAEGVLSDVSVGFSNSDWRKPTDAERAAMPGVDAVLEDGDLDEVSAVLRGAVPGAQMVSIRSAQVDSELVVALARKVAAGELSQAEAKIALELAGQGDEGEQASGEPEPEAPDEVVEPTELLAEVDAALAAIAGRSRFGV